MYIKDTGYLSILEGYQQVQVQEGLVDELTDKLSQLVEKFPEEVMKLFREIVARVERGESLDDIRSVKDLDTVSESLVAEGVGDVLIGLILFIAGKVTVAVTANVWAALLGRVVEAKLLNSAIVIPLSTALASAPPFVAVIVIAALIIMGLIAVIAGVMFLFKGILDMAY